MGKWWHGVGCVHGFGLWIGAVSGGDVDAGDEGPIFGDIDIDLGGTWMLSYNGFPGGSFPLGPFDFAAPTVPYPVSEYRGRLTSPGGEGT